jgi:hypothetical protein
MDGGGRAGEIVDLVYFRIEREGNVMSDDFEVLMIKQLLDVTASACEEIVNTEDNGPIGEQALAEMRAKEAGTAGNEYACLKVHLGFLWA